MVRRNNPNYINDFLQKDVARYIALNRNEFQMYYSVVNKLFNRLHANMKKVDPYYKMYASTAMYAGSHFDHLRVTKPDEFDIIFAVGLPFNMKEDRRGPARSDIVIEPQDPGYVELKTGHQPQTLLKTDKSQINSTAYKWVDEDGYILRSKFKDWFKSIVDKALNKLTFVGNKPTFNNNGKTYVISKTEAGPSLQLIVEDPLNDFKMDIDLVPALKFPDDRWPIGVDYKPIPPARKRGKQFFVVVPKPNKKDLDDEEAIARGWRLGLQTQERELIFDKNFLKPAIRLMKRFRDVQEMDKIASYYIKTIFFSEVERRGPEDTFWRGPVSAIFKHMVEILMICINDGEIDYYWNGELNFIKNLDRSILIDYYNKLQRLYQALCRGDVTVVAECILYPDELEDYLRRN